MQNKPCQYFQVDIKYILQKQKNIFQLLTFLQIRLTQ